MERYHVRTRGDFSNHAFQLHSFTGEEADALTGEEICSLADSLWEVNPELESKRLNPSPLYFLLYQGVSKSSHFRHFLMEDVLPLSQVF